MWGGPNSDYSLAEARVNFRTYRVMYSPGRDQRITGGDSALEYETKGRLMAVFDLLGRAQPTERTGLFAEIERLEAILRAETDRQVREWEVNKRGDA